MSSDSKIKHFIHNSNDYNAFIRFAMPLYYTLFQISKFFVLLHDLTFPLTQNSSKKVCLDI